MEQKKVKHTFYFLLSMISTANCANKINKCEKWKSANFPFAQKAFKRLKEKI